MTSDEEKHSLREFASPFCFFFTASEGPRARERGGGREERETERNAKGRFDVGESGVVER